MTAEALVHQGFPTTGRAPLFHHDSNVLTRILQHFGRHGQAPQETNSRSFDAEDVDALRRSLDATYVGNRATEGTHGSAETPAYDWLIAMEGSKSVEDVILASMGRIHESTIDRVRHLRSYDRTYVRGREPMSTESLKHAVRFLVTYQMPPPRITETLGGDLLLEWSKSKHGYLCIQFTGEIAFFLLIDGPNRMKGRLSTDEWSSELPLDIIRSWFL